MFITTAAITHRIGWRSGDASLVSACEVLGLGAASCSHHHQVERIARQMRRHQMPDVPQTQGKAIFIS